MKHIINLNKTTSLGLNLVENILDNVSKKCQVVFKAFYCGNATYYIYNCFFFFNASFFQFLHLLSFNIDNIVFLLPPGFLPQCVLRGFK